MRELAYQQRVLKLLDEYLAELVQQKAKANKVAAANAKQKDPDLHVPSLNFPELTWQALKKANKLPLSRATIPHSPRPDGTGKPVPNIVYKVPTAGGKTFLAVSSLAKIFHQYLNSHKGFVLWIVPNEAIYTQTKKHLNDRRHPYRQLLDNLTGNAVKIMEKSTSLNANDVKENLCIMLLMLQSSNRQNKATLKIFQERGDVNGFAPEAGNQLAHKHAKEAVPNLDVCDLFDASYPWMPVRESLGNALRLICPVVVMDEGHKGTSELAFETLYGFNPSFVLELTATPKDIKERKGKNPQPARYQNILAEVSGIELDHEGMIKMPINLDSRQSTDWKSTLRAALERLNGLQQQANTLQANQNRYIRPIMLVQVERAGNDQRDGEHIHAEDVKQWLTTAGRLDLAEVAIKTAVKNDLNQPENQDLLHQSNRIRVIITVQALQEGWDCSFAYVLCSLASRSNQSAMTQLIGRILRQPDATKTQVALLDESYVITHHTATNEVVERIKDGLEKDGMGDLSQNITVAGMNGSDTSRQKIERKPQFKNTEIFLPKVLWVQDDKKRELDYEEDILYALDWHNTDTAAFVEKVPKNYQAATRQLRKIWLEPANGANPMKAQYLASPIENEQFDCAHASQLISDIVPNPWLAREIVGNVIAGLQARSFKPEKINRFSSYLYEALRKWLFEQRDSKAEALFKSAVKDGKIQFYLRADKDIGKVNWRMPMQSASHQPENAAKLTSSKGEPLQRSLFLPMYQDDMNADERKIALYLEDAETIHWWHRNVSRNHYSVQGWRRDKIYPDFICALNPHAYNAPKLIVLEMKGEHLAGNEDTEYKKALLDIVTQSFSIDHSQRIGEASLGIEDGTQVHCELVLFSDWQTSLPKILQP